MVPLSTQLVPIVAEPNFGFHTGHPRCHEASSNHTHLRDFNCCITDSIWQSVNYLALYELFFVDTFIYSFFLMFLNYNQIE